MSQKGNLKKVTFRMPPSLLNDFDDEAEDKGYKDRSEALREAARDFIRNPREGVMA